MYATAGRIASRELKCRQADNNKRTELKNRNRGGFTMKIAVPYENGQIFSAFRTYRDLNSMRLTTQRLLSLKL